MKKRYVAFLLLLIVLAFSFLISGCKQESIKFYRESSINKVLNDCKINNKKQVTKSSGFVIYKDDQYNGSKKNNFGPKDIDFDLPINIK